MRTLIRSLILLGLVVWIGGLVYFGVVVAPVAFGVVMPRLPDPAMGLAVAGATVRACLLRLHDMGLVCGVALLVLAIIERAAHLTRRSIGPQLVLLATMLALTAYSQFSVIPRMETLRIRAGAAMDDPAAANPAKAQFNRLHGLSTNLEGVVLLGGLALIVLYSRSEPAA